RVRLAHRGVDVAHGVLRFAQAALELVGGQLALQLVAHRGPLRAAAPHPQPGEARRLRQPLRAEDEQRHHRDDEEFAEADVEHGRAPRTAASALDVVVVALLVGRVVAGLARLVAQLAGGLVVVAHALLEFLDRAAEVLGAAGQALGAEDQQHDREHDQPVPDAETAHGLSRMYVGGVRRIAQRAAPGAAARRGYCTGGSGSVVAGLSSTVSNGCGCGGGSTNCGSAPVAAGGCRVVAGCAATGREAASVPRSARAAAVASSSSSRKLTIAVDGVFGARPSKIIRGVVSMPYTASLAASSIDN